MSSSRNPRIGRRAAALLVGTAMAGAALTLPAAAHDLSAGHYVVDTDRGYLFHVGTGVADVTATHFHANSHLQSEVIGTVNNLSSSGCEFVRVIWYYADGTTGANESARACAGEHGWRGVDLHSARSRDVYRIDLQLRRASNRGGAGARQSTATRYVADGLTGRHIDRDDADWWSGGKPVLRADVDYRLRNNSVSTVSGTLTWQDTLHAASARVVIVWTYQDGTQQRRASAWVHRGQRIHLVKSSSATTDIRSVTTRVETHDRAGALLHTYGRTSHLGDRIAS